MIVSIMTSQAPLYPGGLDSDGQITGWNADTSGERDSFFTLPGDSSSSEFLPLEKLIIYSLTPVKRKSWEFASIGGQFGLQYLQIIDSLGYYYNIPELMGAHDGQRSGFSPLGIQRDQLSPYGLFLDPRRALELSSGFRVDLPFRLVMWWPAPDVMDGIFTMRSAVAGTNDQGTGSASEIEPGVTWGTTGEDTLTYMLSVGHTNRLLAV